MQRRPTFFKAHPLRTRKSVDLGKPSRASANKEGLPAITPEGAHHSSAAGSSSGDLRTPSSSGSSQTDAARSLSSHGIVSPGGDRGKLESSPPPSPPAAPGGKGGRNRGSSRWPWKRSRGGAARARAQPGAGVYAHDLGDGGEDRGRGASDPAPFCDGGTFGAGQLIDDEELLLTERGRGEGNGLSDNDDDLEEPAAHERGSVHFGGLRHRARQDSFPAPGLTTTAISETSEEADAANLEADDEVRPGRAATAPATMEGSAVENRPEAAREGEREPRQEREPERDKGEPEEEQSWWSARVAAWQRNSDDDSGGGGGGGDGDEGTGGGFFAQALSALAAATSSDSPLPPVPLPPEGPRCPGTDRDVGGDGSPGKSGKEEQNPGSSCGEGVGKGGWKEEALRSKEARLDGDRKPPGGSRCLLLDSRFFCKANGTEQMGFVLRNEDLRTGFKQFLSKRWCAENMDFVEEVMRYQKIVLRSDGGKDLEALALGESIEETFLLKSSPREVNIGQDMRRSCLERRARDVRAGAATMDTFNAVAFELLALMAHTSLRDFKVSPLYATIEACVQLGPRDVRNSGATSTMTFVDDDDPDEGVMFRPRTTRQDFMSEAEHRASDWYGIADNAAVDRSGTWS